MLAPQTLLKYQHISGKSTKNLLKNGAKRIPNCESVKYILNAFSFSISNYFRAGSVL